jgi:WD40 repeat protein
MRCWQLSEPPYRVWSGARGHNAAFIDERRLVSARHVIDFSSVHPPDVPFDPAAVTALIVPLAGRNFVLGRADGSLEAHHLNDGQELAQWRGHDRKITALACSPDGIQLASSSVDGTVKLWHGTSHHLENTLRPSIGAVHAVAWSREGKLLTASGEYGVVLWDLRTSRKPQRLSERLLPASGVALSADAIAFSEVDGTIEIRDLRSGQVRRTLRGHTVPVATLVYSQDGKLLASAGSDGTVRIWDAGNGESLAVFRRQTAWGGLPAFDPRGRYLVFNQYLYDLRTRTEAVLLHGTGHTGGVSFTPDGSLLLIGNTYGAVMSCSLAEVDRARAAAAGPGEAPPAGAVRVDAATVLVPGGHGDGIWGTAASPDGRWVATASHDQTVNLWDGTTLKLVRTLRGHSALVWCVAFSLDSRYLASGSGDIRVWEVATGRQVHHFQFNQKLVRAVAFHPTQPWLASAAGDGNILLWDLKAGRLLGQVHHFDHEVVGLAFRPDGRWLAAACQDRHVALWQCEESPLNRPPDRLLAGHDAPVWAVAFSPDGKTLASGSEQGTVLLHDGETFERQVALRGGAIQVRGLSFSRDGRRLAVAAYQADTLVWDLVRLRGRLAEMGLDW